eukprot:917705-Prorocentrum_minimum.AAC.3
MQGREKGTRDTHAGKRKTGEPAKRNTEKKLAKISISIPRHNTNDLLLQPHAPPVDPHTARITVGKVPLCRREGPRHEKKLFGDPFSSVASYLACTGAPAGEGICTPPPPGGSCPGHDTILH